MAMFVYGGQWFQADVLSVAGGDRTRWRVVILALAVPFVLSMLNHAWLVPPEPVRVGALVVWLGGTILVRLGTASHIGEQLSWVGGTTRILVFVDHDAPPPDHTRIESLVDLVPQD